MLTRPRTRLDSVLVAGLASVFVAGAALALNTPVARAQTAPPPPAPSAPVPTVPTDVPPPAPDNVGGAPTGDAPTLTESHQRPDVQYGVAVRGRWVSVPSWLLGLFTEKNVPLSSWGMGLEAFRRKGDLDIALGLTFTKIGPPDGNWLGKNHDPGIDTDFIQFKNFNMIGADVAFLWHEQFNDYFAVRYGGGLGLGIITGDMLRISSGPFCTLANASDTSQCYPAYNGDPNQRIPVDQFPSTRNAPDGGPRDPHQFKDTNVPGAIPIINISAGLVIHIPEAKGLEIRPLEFGFYNAFVVGGGAGYVF